MKIKFSDIIIPYAMKSRPPKPEKVQKHLRRFLAGADISMEIEVDQNGVLTDGYARYCALLLDGYQYIEDLVIHVSEKRRYYTYIFGKHKPTGKTYVWYVKPTTKRKNKLVKDGYALVDTSQGLQTVKIEHIINKEERLTDPKINKAVISGVDKTAVSYDAKLGYVSTVTH